MRKIFDFRLMCLSTVLLILMKFEIWVAASPNTGSAGHHIWEISSAPCNLLRTSRKNKFWFARWSKCNRVRSIWNVSMTKSPFITRIGVWRTNRMKYGSSWTAMTRNFLWIWIVWESAKKYSSESESTWREPSYDKFSNEFLPANNMGWISSLWNCPEFYFERP